eukprot:12379017-Heterocapsa_arctica.AAC.1
MSCRCPFIVEALKGSEKRSIKAPIAAAAKVAGSNWSEQLFPRPAPGGPPEPGSSSKSPRVFTPHQLAQAEQ